MLVAGSSYLAGGVLVGSITGTPVGAAELACGAVVAMSIGGLLPDMDTPNSTLAHSVGPITLGLARVIGFLFGGHRNGTHSPVFCIAVGGLASFALAGTGLVHFQGLTLTTGSVAALLIGYFAIALLLSRMCKIHGSQCVALSAGVVALALLAHLHPGFIVGAVVLGAVSHLLADGMTPEGIVPGWPLSHRRVSLPLIGHTGDWRETVIVAVIVIGAAFASYPTFAPVFQNHPIARAADAITHHHHHGVTHPHHPARPTPAKP